MIKRIEIKNYKSCADLSLEELGPVVVLVGRNGVGKSNILKAISWAAKSATSASSVDMPRGINPRFIPMTVAVSVEINKINYDYLIAYSYSNEQLSEQVKSATGREVPKVAFRRDGRSLLIDGRQTIPLAALAPALAFISSFMPQEDSLLEEVLPLFDYLKRIRYYTLDELVEPEPTNDIVRDEEYKAWVSRYNSTGYPSNSVIIRIIYMYFNRRDEFNEIKSLLGADGLGLIDEISVESFDLDSLAKEHGPTTPRFYSVLFQPASDLNVIFPGFNYNDLSVGTRRIIQIVVSLIFDKSSVMLIEHPEDGIHAGLTRKLISLLKAYAGPTQIFLASHSLVVFDELSPEDVRLVTMELGRTALRPLTADEIKAAHQYISEDGPFSSFLELAQPE